MILHAVVKEVLVPDPVSCSDLSRVTHLIFLQQNTADQSDIYEVEISDTLQVRYGGLMAGSAAFDTAAFGITGAEAELMDPQQRLLMEVRKAEVASG